MGHLSGASVNRGLCGFAAAIVVPPPHEINISAKQNHRD
jgi:hypothetical protein